MLHKTSASSDQTLDTWRRQARIFAGEEPGLTTAERTELVRATGRITELETELAVHRRAAELFNRRRWQTRIELVTALLVYLEIFHNRRRRHSSLGMMTAVEFELHHQPLTAS